MFMSISEKKLTGSIEQLSMWDPNKLFLPVKLWQEKGNDSNTIIHIDNYHHNKNIIIYK